MRGTRPLQKFHGFRDTMNGKNTSAGILNAIDVEHLYITKWQSKSGETSAKTHYRVSVGSRVLGHFWYPLCDRCFGAPWNASIVFLSSSRARSRLWRSSKCLSLIGYSHVLENGWEQEAGCLQNKTKTKTANHNPTKTKPKQPKKTPRKLRETLPFQKSPQAAQYCFAMS